MFRNIFNLLVSWIFLCPSMYNYKSNSVEKFNDLACSVVNLRQLRIILMHMNCTCMKAI